MEIFKIDQFNELLDMRGLHQVSIYSPTSRDSTDNYQGDIIHFKNQLKEAVSQLTKQYSMTEAEAKDYLKPGFDLLDDRSFWQHGSDALAFFHSSAGTQIKKLPLPLDEPRTFVGNSFMLRPLIPLLNSDGRFYILNLNLNDVRLYEATPNTISEVVLNDDVPTTIDDYLKYVEREEALQFRSGQGGKAGAMFHGQGVTDTEKEDIQQYFYDLSKKIDDIINCDPLPTVLAGVEYLIPMYKKASDYSDYEEDIVEGSYSEEDAALLHEKAFDLIEPRFDQERTAAFERFADLKNGDRASADTEKVILAALTGQVEILFVQEDAVLWGSYDKQRYELQLNPVSTPETKDLLTEASVQTILQNGKVYSCDADEMPVGDSVVAAVFRNPVTV